MPSGNIRDRFPAIVIRLERAVQMRLNLQPATANATDNCCTHSIRYCRTGSYHHTGLWEKVLSDRRNPILTVGNTTFVGCLRRPVGFPKTKSDGSFWTAGKQCIGQLAVRAILPKADATDQVYKTSVAPEQIEHRIHRQPLHEV